MVTVADIAKQALDAVSVAITDAIHDATLSYDTQGAYDVATGEYAVTTTTATGRAVVDGTKPAADIFPDYTIGPKDELILLEGFTDCKETWKLDANSRQWVIRAVQDIVAAGSVFYVIGRRSD